MAKIPLIGNLGDNDGGLQLPRPKIYRPGLDVKIVDGDPAHPFRPGNLDDGVPGMEGGGGICRSYAVAGISADGSDVADLRAAYHVNGFPQNVNVFLDNGIFCDMGKAGKGSDTDSPVLLIAYAPHIVYPVNAHQFLSGPLSFTHLYQHIASAGDNLGFGVLQKQANRILNAFCLIKCFYIIHSENLLPSSVAEFFWP